MQITRIWNTASVFLLFVFSLSSPPSFHRLSALDGLRKTTSFQMVVEYFWGGLGLFWSMCGVILALCSLLFFRAHHHSRPCSPVTSRDLLKWAASRHIKGTTKKLLTDTVSPHLHRLHFIDIIYVLRRMTLCEPPLDAWGLLSRGWHRGRCVHRSLERCPLCIMLVEGVAFAHKAECRKASKPLTAFETGRAKTSGPPWFYCLLLYPHILPDRNGSRWLTGLLFFCVSVFLVAFICSSFIRKLCFSC